MLVAQWGSIYWYFIHWSVWFIRDWPMGDDERIKRIERLKVFYTILPYLLPCARCGIHCKKFIKANNPLKCQTADRLARWSHGLHNHVNSLLGKDSISYEEINKIYDKDLVGLPDHKILYKMANIISDEATKRDDGSPHQIFYREFFKLLPYIFPCIVCSENLGLMIPYRKKKADGIWLEIAVPILKTHLPSRKDRFVFKCAGWEDDGRAGFLRIYARQKIRLQVENFMGGKAVIHRYLPVINNQEYEIYLRGVSRYKKTVMMRLITQDGYPISLYSLKRERSNNEVFFPHDGDIYLRFLIPRYEDIIIFEIFFTDNSPFGDRFIIKELMVTPFLE